MYLLLRCIYNLQVFKIYYARQKNKLNIIAKFNIVLNRLDLAKNKFILILFQFFKVGTKHSLNKQKVKLIQFTSRKTNLVFRIRFVTNKKFFRILSTEIFNQNFSGCFLIKLIFYDTEEHYIRRNQRFSFLISFVVKIVSSKYLEKIMYKNKILWKDYNFKSFKSC